VSFRSSSLPVRALCVAWSMVALSAAGAGCSADRPIHVLVGDNIRLPERSVVVFFADGLGEREFDEMLAEGRLPNISRHILSRGPRVENAVTCIPSITYALGVTFVTGKLPGHHGVVSNKYFEPSTGKFKNYCHMQTYEDADLDYRSTPTIYEILHDRTTVSIQLAIHRGVTHSINNWATSGLDWWVSNYSGVDALVAQQFELIGQRTRWWGQWPDLIMAYFPAIDRYGHEIGPRTESYRKEVANVDAQIGRICEALKEIGMYDRTYLCLMSDHGMIAVQPDKALDIAALLERSTGRPVWYNTYTTRGDEGKLLSGYDYAVACSASRWAAVYPLPNAWQAANSGMGALAAAMDQFDAEVTAGGGVEAARTDVRAAMPGWMAEAAAHPAVEVMACSFHRGKVHVFTRDGHALIARSKGTPERHVVYQQAGKAVFEHAALPPDAKIEDGSDSRAWLRLTARDRYPDFIPQIVDMFDSERAGSIVFFASDGWDFSATNDPYGGHGSILPGEMRVPMAFAGPGLSPDIRVPYARNCDIMPTILHLLGTEVNRPGDDPIDIDGVNLLPSSMSRGD
jgi:hypothetical protein